MGPELPHQCGSPPNGRSAGSLSWGGLANSYFWIDQASGIAGVIAAQIFPFADRLVLDLYASFERAVYGRGA